MREFFRWEILLCKRFFRKKSFLLLCLLLPLMGFFLRLGSRGESGILQLGLVAEEKDGQLPELNHRVVDKLLTGDTVLRIESLPDEQRARELLRRGKLDAVWILPSDLEARIEKRVGGKNISLVTVLEREDSALVLLSREVLYRALYPEISPAIYQNFLAEKFSLNLRDPAVQRELAARYAAVKIDGQLIAYANAAGQTMQRQNYLRSPLRGLGALWLFLMSFVALLYFLEDQRKGLFAFLPRTAERWYVLRYLLAVQGIASLGLIALLLAGGLFQTLGRELLALLCLNLLALLFVLAVGVLTGGRQTLVLALLLPALLLCLLGAPIFLDFGIRALQLINPVYYYLKLAVGTLAPVVELFFSIV